MTTPKMRGGYAKLRRGLLEHLPSLTSIELRLFTVLMITVSPFPGTLGTVEITDVELSERSGITRKSVKVARDRLLDRGWIEHDPAPANDNTAKSVYRIVKYDTGDKSSCVPSTHEGKGLHAYPVPMNAGLHAYPVPTSCVPSTHEDSETRTSGGAKEAQENLENSYREQNSERDGFEDFWNAYPRKLNRSLAETAWDAEVRQGADPALLIACSKNYATATEEDGREQRYIKLPANFLSEKCYEDYEKEPEDDDDFDPREWLPT